MSRYTKEDIFRIVEEEDRYVISSAQRICDEDSLGYEWTMLEKNLTETSPILASSRIGYSFSFKENADVNTLKKTPFIFLQFPDDFEEDLDIVPGGLYLDIYTRGYSNIQKPYEVMSKYMKENGYKAIGKVMTFFPVDITVTDEEKEGMMELQVAVKKI